MSTPSSIGSFFADFACFVSFLGAAVFFAAGGFDIDDLSVVVLEDVDFESDALAADAFVAAVRAEANFGRGFLADVDFVATVPLVGSSGWSSAFFARPLRAGAFSMLALKGDSGGVPLVCARWARVRTMILAGNDVDCNSCGRAVAMGWG